MTTVWKLNNEFYVLYTEDKDIMKKIKRSYQEFVIMASYYRQGIVFGIQYKLPVSKKRTAYRFARTK